MDRATQALLTSAELCAVTGIPSLTLSQWVGKGLLTPARVGGRGRGYPHLFSPTQALAVLAGLRWRGAGAGAEWVAGVVKCVGSLSPAAVEEDLARGRTFVVPSVQLRAAWIPGWLTEPTGGDRVSRPALSDERLDLGMVQADLLTRTQCFTTAGRQPG